MKDDARRPKANAATAFGTAILAAASGVFLVGGGIVAAAAAEGCTGEAAAYERALGAGTTEALQEFLTEYPACPLTPTVFALLNAPREQSAATPPTPPPTPPTSLSDILPAAGGEPADDGPVSAADRGIRPNDPGRGDRESGGGDTGGGGTGGGGAGSGDGGTGGGTDPGSDSGPPQ